MRMYNDSGTMPTPTKVCNVIPEDIMKRHAEMKTASIPKPRWTYGLPCEEWKRMGKEYEKEKERRIAIAKVDARKEYVEERKRHFTKIELREDNAK